MDIFNRPPAISEDTLQYIIYLDSTTSSSQSSAVALCTQIQHTIDALLPVSFVWHRDAFELKAVPTSRHESHSSGPGWKLEGRMRIGDSVDDEWCVVWLMKELSKVWDIVVSVFDSDGEFLLIEAADALPAWVSPSNAENRVWIYQSHVHLVPIFYTSAPNVERRARRLSGAQDSDDEGDGNTHEDDYLGVFDALRLVRDPAADTVAPGEVEARIWNRINRYPRMAVDHMHLTRVYLPTDIALALQQNPALVQRAIEAFYTRDAIQLRPVQKMVRFPPEPSILTSIRMSRPAYAQLVGQKFHPPKVFGRWSEREGTPEWRRRNLGMKIACGFEMLYAETKGKSQTAQYDASTQSTEALKDALRRDPEYSKYIQSLVKADFFEQEIEGSQKWKDAEDRAAKAWVKARRTDNATRQSFASQVNEAITKTNSSPLMSTLPNEAEESDDWLNVDPEMLDKILQQSHGTSGSDSRTPDGGDLEMHDPATEMENDEEAATNNQAERLKSLAGKVQDFVEGEGTLEGAKFDDDILSDEEFSDDESEGGESDADVDMGDFAHREEAISKLVPPLLPSEYGVMPPSFSQSQDVTAPTITTEFVPMTAAADSPTLASSKPIRRPILTRDNFDGVDSDDETDSEDEHAVINEDGEEDEEEDRPQVIGEIEIDMEQEEEEFLRFSREALGITEDQWAGILQDRAGRGAFIPSSIENPPKKPANAVRNSVPGPGTPPLSTTKSTRNPDLDSFEAVMQAMDAQLQELKGKSTTNSKPKASPPVPAMSQSQTGSKGKGKGKEQGEKMSFGPFPQVADVDEDGDEDVDDAMSAELHAALATGSDSEDEGDETGEPSADYNLIKNFLESFKSQGGLSGPVGNLAGRLEGGWGLPRDN